MSKHPKPWRFVDGGDGLAELFDAKNAFVCPVPLEVAEEICAGVNLAAERERQKAEFLRSLLGKPDPAADSWNL